MADAPSSGPARYRFRSLPASIWILGFVSMFMDISSAMIHARPPVYLVSVLDASTVVVGIIEGVAGATASITKIFSDALSDRLGRAFGMFYPTTGLALLAVSVIAGELWDRWGPEATFLAGAAFTFLALIGLWPARKHFPRGIPR
jgi:hypothetical protein